MNRWNILYRGSLTSCNYTCGYCPFAKTKNTREELEKDAAEVDRFVDWVAQLDHSVGVLFTPWGEAIVHAYYRDALVRLSRLPHVQRVAIQTNLSVRLNDLAAADSNSLAIWATFHPGEVPLSKFIQRCQQLSKMEIAYSVGVVGLREHFDVIDELREQLAPKIYLWVNCFKREPGYYSDEEVTRLRSVDPYFSINRKYYPSDGKPCLAGESTFTVNGSGDVRRCHFIPEKLGNIYTDNVNELLRPRLCTNATCGCHIGYVHQPELELYRLFGDNVLERIPATWPLIEAEYSR